MKFTKLPATRALEQDVRPRLVMDKPLLLALRNRAGGLILAAGHACSPGGAIPRGDIMRRAAFATALNGG